MFPLLFATLLAGSPVAGGITGDLRLGEKYLADVPVTLTCGSEKVEGKTDAAGSFRLTVKGGGKCELAVTYDRQTATIDVVVFEQPAKYRLVLELRSGKYALKRV